MNTVILICIVVVTVAVVVSTVYFIITMIQLGKTVQKLDDAITQLDSDMKSVRNILGYVSSFSAVTSSLWVKIIAAFVPKIASVFFKKHKHEEENHE